MDLNKLSEIQGGLDYRIIEEKGLQGQDLFENKISALIVEIAELENEVRCFKHWSDKPPSPKSVIIEEYVDGWHFILSIGNDFNTMHESYDTWECETLTTQFNELYESVSEFRKMIIFESPLKNQLECYAEIVRGYIGLGRMLTFSDEEIEQAYLDKNKINHERQSNGY